MNSRNWLLGLVYQQFTGTQWVTTLELTSDAWATAAETHVLHQAPLGTPGPASSRTSATTSGCCAVDRDFYGIFSGQQRAGRGQLPERGDLPARRRLGQPDGCSTPTA